jgi:hypothetical protein
VSVGFSFVGYPLLQVDQIFHLNSLQSLSLKHITPLIFPKAAIFTSLTFEGSMLLDAFLRDLPNLNHLRSLRLDRCSYPFLSSLASLDIFSRLRELRSLRITEIGSPKNGALIIPSLLRQVAHLTKLETLCLYDLLTEEEHFRALWPLTGLRSLYVNSE